MFVDIEEETCGMDPAKIEAAITENTVAIMPVHCYGKPVNMDAIQAHQIRNCSISLAAAACHVVTAPFENFPEFLFSVRAFSLLHFSHRSFAFNDCLFRAIAFLSGVLILIFSPFF